ncbi:MAG: CHASE domain-containing protein [Proteobacteria bacterium]|nr:CHASE domain-containing protein [Pseudomonadota bacterium]
MAAGYLILTFVSRLFELPDGSDSALWFPAGFALAALLIMGPRYWLSIWLCAAISHAWWGMGWLSLLTGVGSALQALAGWWLIRRLTPKLTRRNLAVITALPTDADLLRGLVLGGPLACLVSATLTTLVLHGLGQLPQERLLGQWLTWYCADVLGVLLIAPLTYLAWQGKVRSAHELCLRIGLPLLLIAGLLGLNSVSHDREQVSVAHEQAEAQMQGIYDRNIMQMRTNRSELEALERFFVASEEVTLREFTLFTESLLDRPGLVALDWLPRVSQAERPAFEAALRQRGRAGLLEPDAQGHAVPASKRETYFPVALSASPATAQSTHDLLGLDRSSSPLHQPAMEEARDHGKSVATDPFILLRGGRQGVVVYRPVYQTGFQPASASVAARRAALRGFVAIVLDVERLFAPFFEDASARRIDFRAQDVGAAATVPLIGSLTGDAQWVHEINMGGRRWRLEMRAVGLLWHSGETGADRLFLVGTMLAALLAAFATLSAASHAAAREAKRRQLQKLAARLERDVQARTRELAQRDEESRALVTHLVDGVIQIDRHGTVQSANPAVERILGWQPVELIGHNVSRIVPEPHRSAHDDYLERYLRTGEARIIGLGREVMGLHRDGRQVPLELAIGQYEVHGEVYFTGILRDISERQRAIAALEEAQREAEAANQAKSAFLAAMSHEIRTPMNGVMGSVDLLRHASLTPHQMDLANTIRDSALNLLTIIDDILDFSKIEAGRMELERASMCPADGAESACDALLPLAVRKGVTLTVFVDPRLPRAVIGDALRLRQVMNNLLSNAIKFSSSQARPGRVRLRMCLESADRLRLTVSDNGIGMDTATQAKLFKPFTQADLSTTRRFGGTGLGLSICKHLVDLMGRSIDVVSEPGAGAMFSVSLPLEREPAWTEPAPQAPLAGLDIAIVAEDAADGRDWAAYLEHAGARTQRYADAESARSEYAGRPGALLLLEAGERADQGRLNLRGNEGLPAVLLGRGRRRQPRLVSTGLVVLDRDALHRATLLRALLLAAGRAQPEAEAWGSPEGAQDGPTLPPADGPRILVAEDHDINRKVIALQLAQLGYAADMAADGQAALARWRSRHYDLLLTDVHMPELDGYALTEAIRREEAEGARRPIIALTANALKGEEDRCLAAGMDAFLSKPVPLDVLQATLEEWLPPVAPQPWTDASTARAGNTASTVLDRTVLAGILGSDEPALINEFLQDFGQAAASAALALRAACERQDWAEAGGIAHKLKSSSRSVGALALGDICASIEAAAQAGQGPQVLEHLAEFEHRLKAVQAELAKVQEEVPGNS